MAKRREILLLEDDMIQTMLFRAAIDNIHGVVSNFTDAEQALKVANRSTFDLYIVDLGIFLKPGVFDQFGGIRFVSSLRKAVSRTAPIIIATADRSPKPLLACFRAGADDYVLKDEGIAKVVSRLKGWVNQLPLSESALAEQREQVLTFLSNAAEKENSLP